MEIPELRQEIDGINEEMKRLMTRRMELARQIGEMKKAQGLPVFDPQREAAILEKMTAGTGADAKYLRRFFAEIFAVCRDCQNER